jgi:hypothetical protein
VIVTVGLVIDFSNDTGGIQEGLKQEAVLQQKE